MSRVKILPRTVKCYNGIKYTVFRDSQGYLRSDRNQYIRLHRLIWQDVAGEIPEGHHIHHIDGDKDNNDISNLQCMSHSEHVKLHGSRFEEVSERNKRGAQTKLGADPDYFKRIAEKGALRAVTKPCKHCGTEYEGKANSKYCSNCNTAQKRKAK